MKNINESVRHVLETEYKIGGCRIGEKSENRTDAILEGDDYDARMEASPHWKWRRNSKRPEEGRRLYFVPWCSEGPMVAPIVDKSVTQDDGSKKDNRQGYYGYDDLDTAIAKTVSKQSLPGWEGATDFHVRVYKGLEELGKVDLEGNEIPDRDAKEGDW